MSNCPQILVTQAPLKRHVLVCNGKSCTAKGSQETLEAFWETLKQHELLYGKRGSLDAPVVVTTCGSVGLCNVGPAVLVYPDGTWYCGVTPVDVPELVESHLLQDTPVDRLLARQLP